jgi:dihydroorotate dehydrogenase
MFARSSRFGRLGPAVVPARFLSTTNAPSPPFHFRLWSMGTLALFGGSASLLLYYASDTRAAFYSHIAIPLLQALTDAEESHRFAIQWIRSGFTPKDRGEDAVCLETKVHT